jgi:hypothetical protein
MLILLCTLARAATPTAGLELAPLSRADVVWVDEGRTTGTGVGEFDGTVWPSLRAFGGAWLSERFGLTGGLGIARLTTTTWTGDTWRSRHVGVVRPSLDGRVSLLPRSDSRPRPLLLLGGYGDIPSARDTSNAFTDAEQELADEDAAVERARLGGFGLRAGAGVDLRVHEHVSIGFIWAARWHRATLRGTEATAVTSWLGSDAALTVAFEWPKRVDEAEQ